MNGVKMNIEICKNCPRKLVFTYNRENFTFSPRRKQFHCYKKIDFLDFEFGYSNISSYEFVNTKWKRIKLRLLQNIFNWWNPTNQINKLFKKFKLENMNYDYDGFKCPYYVEHELYDWNEENE